MGKRKRIRVSKKMNAATDKKYMRPKNEKGGGFIEMPHQ
jgi:hypothetical protein